jgi:hypothetical protein
LGSGTVGAGGFTFQGNSDDNIIVGATISNAHGGEDIANGVFLSYLAARNIVVSATISGMGDSGVYLYGGSGQTDNIVSHSTLSNNFWTGIYLDSANGNLTGNYFNSIAIFNNESGVGTATNNRAGVNTFNNIP